VVRDVSDQHRYERSLETLRETTRDLMSAEDPESVAEVAVQAAARALDLPLSAVFLHDETREVLEPTAATEAARETFAEIPTFTGEADSLAWRAFESGEPQRYEDPDTAERLYNESTAASAELIVPLETHGVLVTGYVERRGFDEEQVRLFHTLAATVTTALDRVESAERLRERNEQLEQFSNALSHDLRNPLNTARATLALARASADGETLEYLDQLEDTHRRMASLIEDVLALAAGPADPDTSTVDLAALATESWDTVSADRTGATLELEQLGDVTAAPGQLRRLLENLFANALDHAGPTVTVTVGRLPPAADAPGGFYVADDGPGIPPEDRDQVFERGYTGGDGTGLGLDIVTRTARAHDWSVSVTESEAGGARFEIRGPEPGSAAGSPSN
jgi:signal transduction histidine kinase